jgi:hypothetical protein
MTKNLSFSPMNTSTYDQICDGFSLLLPHLSVAISMKAKTFFFETIFVAISTNQVFVETTMKLALHMSSQCKKNCGKLRRKSVEIAMKIYAKTKTYDADVVCATQNRGKLRRKSVAIATKIYAKTKTYDADVVCATQNCGKLRRKSVAIAMKIYAKTKLTT